MPPRLSALLVLLVLPACTEPRTANEEPTCTSEAECVRLQRASLAALRACLLERKRAGYVGPGSPPPPSCDALKAESDRWASTVERLHRRKQQEAEEQKGGYEVPPLPSASAAAAP